MSNQRRKNKHPSARGDHQSHNVNSQAADKLESGSASVTRDSDSNEHDRGGYQQQNRSSYLGWDTNNTIALGTILLGIVGIGSLVLTVFTLKETANEFAINQQAFLYNQSVTITGGNSGEQKQHYVYQVFFNSGLTQARRVKVSYGISEAKGVTNVKYEMPETKFYVENNDTQFNIIPSKETGGVVMMIDSDVADRLQHLTSGLLVYGTISYCDIFGEPHVTRYCRKLVDIGIDSRTGDRRFDFGGCTDQSHACDDEDCPNGPDTPKSYCEGTHQ